MPVNSWQAGVPQAAGVSAASAGAGVHALATHEVNGNYPVRVFAPAYWSFPAVVGDAADGVDEIIATVGD